MNVKANHYKMKIIACFLGITLLTSCVNKEPDNRTHEWLQSNNENYLTQMQMTVKTLGNRNSDKIILEKARNFNDSINKLIFEIDQLSTEQIDKKVEQLFLDLQFPFKLQNLHYSNYRTWQLTNSKSQARTELALFATDILEYYRTQLGLQEVIFDQIQVVFVPDEVIIPKNGDLKGKLLLAATTSNFINCCSLYIEGDSLNIDNGAGIVNIPWEQLNGKNQLNAEMRSEKNSYGGTITYKIKD